MLLGTVLGAGDKIFRKQNKTKTTKKKKQTNQKQTDTQTSQTRNPWLHGEIGKLDKTIIEKVCYMGDMKP